MLHADLVALAALDHRVLVVQVVELQLHEFELRLLGEDAVEHLRLVVEGHAEVPHAALAPELRYDLEGPGLAVEVVALDAHGVQQVVVEVVHAAAFELLLKKGQHVLAGLEHAGGELVRQDVALARVTRGEAVSDRKLALAVEVAVGGVEIGEAGGEELVHHLTYLFLVHLVAEHGQAHHAETETFHILSSLLTISCTLSTPPETVNLMSKPANPMP